MDWEFGIALIFTDDWRGARLARPAGSGVLGRGDMRAMRGDGGGRLTLDTTNSRSDGHAVGSPASPRPRQQALLRALIRASHMLARRYPTILHGGRRAGRRVVWQYPGVATPIRCALTRLTDPEEYCSTMLLASSRALSLSLSALWFVLNFLFLQQCSCL